MSVSKWVFWCFVYILQSEHVMIFFLFLCIVNFSYPSLEEPKPPIALKPEPEVAAVLQEPSVPALVNGIVPAESSTSKTSVVAQNLPESVDSPVMSSTNSGQDLSKMVAGISNQTATTAKAFPQVFHQSQQQYLKDKHSKGWLISLFFSPSLTVPRNLRSKFRMNLSTV